MTKPGKPPPDPRSTQRLSARGKVKELEGIRNVTSPELWDGAGRNQVSGFLPREEELDEAIEPLLRFT